MIAAPLVLPSDAMAQGPEALFDNLAARIQNKVGYLLMTVLIPVPAGETLVRLFSSNQQQYPLGEADRVEDTPWFSRLFAERRSIVANDAARIREWLPGFDVFADQGYGSLANVPIVVSGSTMGILNLMSVSDHFSKGRLTALEEELPLAALAILIARNFLPQTSSI